MILCMLCDIFFVTMRPFHASGHFHFLCEWHLICQIFPVEITLMLGYQAICAWIKYEVISTSFKFKTNLSRQMAARKPFFIHEANVMQMTEDFSWIVANLMLRIRCVVSMGIEI